MLNLTQLIGCGILSVYALVIGGAFVVVKRNKWRSHQQEKLYSDIFN